METIRTCITGVSLITTAALLALSIPACNTTRGLGRDMEKLGEEIQQEAAAHTHY